MNRLYNHVAINASGQDVGTTVDLAQIAAVWPLVGVSFFATMKSGKDVEIIALNDGQRTALIAAWSSWLEQQAARI